MIENVTRWHKHLCKFPNHFLCKRQTVTLGILAIAAYVAADLAAGTGYDGKKRVLLFLVGVAAPEAAAVTDTSNSIVSVANCSKNDSNKDGEITADEINPRPGPGMFAQNCNLSGADLSSMDLSGAYLYQANLTNADLSNTDLTGVNLYRASLAGGNFTGADLAGSYLYQANLSGASLSNSNLSGVNLFRANLAGADLSRTNLSGAYLYQANLTSTNLTDANLSGASLYQADIRNANFTRTDLTGADTRGVISTGCIGQPFCGPR
jgi:uncharacterized protein YjbI with pentapeptide repeats